MCESENEWMLYSALEDNARIDQYDTRDKEESMQKHSATE